MQTRKNKKGGGLFNMFTGSKPTETNTKLSQLKGQRNYNLRHSKSRVANVLSAPGQVRYTNKERIEANYQKAVDQLKSIEKPKETASALQTVATKLTEAMQSQTARETGAVVITIPVGAAQLLYKAIRIFISVMLIIFVDVPSFGSISLGAHLAPNAEFNTTKNAYNKARRLTGAKNSPNIQEYK